MGAIVCAALVLCYWPLFSHSAALWMAPESYYTHIILIPFMSGYLVYDRWSRLKEIPVRPVTWPLLLLFPLLYANFITARSPRDLFLSVMFIATLCLGTVFVAGWRWLWALAAPIGFLIFGLPIWEQAIDVYTQPMQRISSALAFQMLSAVGMNPYKADDTTILTDHFQMIVGVPCSGLRTIVAVLALAVYCIMIGRMRVWANATLLAVAIPLAIMVNGLRIAMIGMVGETMGQDAGMKFHDTSGYISVVVLVVALWQIAKALGMK